MNQYDKLKEIKRDLFRRKKLLKKKYSNTILNKMAVQFGFDDINSDKFVDFVIPPGTTPNGPDTYNEMISDIDNPIYKKQNNIKGQGKGLFTKATRGIIFDEIESTMYRDLVKLNNAERVLEHPVLVVLGPTEQEHTTGFMFRYFLQQSTSPTAPLYEVDKEQYDGWKKLGGGVDNAYYNGISLKWRVRGTLETVIGSDGISRKGVLEGNQDSIDLASETLPALKKQLDNLVKYWKR